MHDAIFREYDIRGKVGSELLLDKVYMLGCALAYYFLHRIYSIKTVAIGWDTRGDSLYIAQELTRAFTDSGLNVIHVGRCPTPVLYFSLHVLPIEAGVMVTASHNGKEYNGIKICIGKESVWGTQITEVKELYYSQKKYCSVLPGNLVSYPMVNRYCTWLAQQFSHVAKSSRSCIIDCSQATAGIIMPELVRLLNWSTVSFIGAEPDPEFQLHDPDPVESKNIYQLKAEVAQSAEFGIAFDGDADRMVAVTPQGQVSADRLIALFAQDILGQLTLEQRTNTTILIDTKSSAMLPELIKKWGGKSYRIRSGHAIIKQAIYKKNAVFAGELSCHFFFNDRYFGYDDGIYAALRLLEVLERNKKTIDELLAGLPVYFNTPELRIACPQKIQEQILARTYSAFAGRQEATLCTLDGVRATLPYGWGLVRKSNTQQVLSLRFESPTAEGLEHIKQDFYAILKHDLDTQTLASLNNHG